MNQKKVFHGKFTGKSLIFNLISLTFNYINLELLISLEKTNLNYPGQFESGYG